MSHVKSTVRRQFGKQAGAYAASRSHAEGSDLDILLDQLQIRDGDVALDVATGPGFVAARVARRAARVVALDLTPEMLRRAGQRMQQQRARNVRLVQADAEALPFRDRTFDVVTCRRSAHHFPVLSTALDEMARVLRPGGRLGITDQASPEDEPGNTLQELLEQLHDPGHVRSLPATEWGRVVEEAGFRLRFLTVVEEPQPFDEWLRTSDASDDARRTIGDLLSAASPEALRSIGYTDGANPSFAKRRVILAADRP